MNPSYLIDIIILLSAAVITVPIFQAIRLGAVPGFLVAGLIVGPSGLGLISHINQIGYLAEIGVVLLLFVIGIELKPARLWLMRRSVFGLGSLQILLTGTALCGASYLFFDIPLRAAILIGPALALSSTAFVLQLLTEQKSLSSIYGRTSFAVLLMQDLAVVPLLALLPLLVSQDQAIGLDIGLALAQSLAVLSLVILIGRYFLHPILHRVALAKNPEVFTASALLIVLGAAVILEHIGLSMAMGAFLAGLLISDSSYKHQVMAEIQPFRGLLLGLFFMSMGMTFNLNLLLESPRYCFAMVGALIAIKAAILFPLTYLFKLSAKKSLAVALILSQSGEFALVLFSLANKSKLLSDDLFQQLLLLVLLSMLITPLLAHMAQGLIKSKDTPETQEPEQIPEGNTPIVLAGFGRVGHRIGEILSLSGYTYVALDSDAAIVKKERANGFPVFYGDVRNPEVLKSAGARHAKVIVVTVNDPEATEKLVASLCTAYPDMKIFVRGHSLTQCLELRSLGADGAVSEYVEVSIELARMALNNVGVSKQEQEQVLGAFRKRYYAEIDSGLEIEHIKTQD
ncbi:MAG: monovalent cation:proton antiporter-2 (CPA2) family protein [Methyloprofundus sp.]|nr:monovalent cation:proton antiporter-2 (CPA2) family protein [Methyloprofundus sp.]MDT8426318.1 monovalent cation:proton antiporter-2 (CPA2) family protein [Methyloprofundus sp.]